MKSLAGMYDVGEGVAKDKETARQWRERASKAKSPSSP
jgi:TPR repeat protein